jgi:hypothetical protein
MLFSRSLLMRRVTVEMDECSRYLPACFSCLPTLMSISPDIPTMLLHFYGDLARISRTLASYSKCSGCFMSSNMVSSLSGRMTWSIGGSYTGCSAQGTRGLTNGILQTSCVSWWSLHACVQLEAARSQLTRQVAKSSTSTRTPRKALDLLRSRALYSVCVSGY